MSDFESDFIKSVYCSKLTKYNNAEGIKLSHEKLENVYHMDSSPIVMLGKAELMMIQFDHQKALGILTKLLDEYKYHMEGLTLFTICLCKLKKSNVLFNLAHELVELFPDHHVFSFLTKRFPGLLLVPIIFQLKSLWMQEGILENVRRLNQALDKLGLDSRILLLWKVNMTLQFQFTPLHVRYYQGERRFDIEFIYRNCF